MLHDPEAGHPTKPPKSGCRRAAGCCGSVFLLILALLFVPPQISRLLHRDLAPEPQRVVPAEDNGWPALVEVGGRVSDRTIGDPLKELGRAPTAEALRQWLGDDAALLPALDRALAHPEFVCPRTGPAAGDTMGGFSALGGTYQIAVVGSALDLVEGRSGEGVTRLRGMLLACQGNQTSGVPMLSMLLGLQFEEHFLRNVRQLVATLTRPLDPAAWRPLEATLRNAPSVATLVASAQRGEYYAFYHRELPNRDLPEDQRWLDSRQPASAGYDPWRTVAQYRALSLAVVEEAAKLRPARDQARLAGVARGGDASSGYNALGAELLRREGPFLIKLLDHADALLAERRLTETVIALRLFFDQEGRLPATLDALVAARLLDAVPADPFDEQPLRYDPARKLLWSIGENEQDDEGVAWTVTGKPERLDRTATLDFEPAARREPS